jgi:hypothetical protein
MKPTNHRNMNESPIFKKFIKGNIDMWVRPRWQWVTHHEWFNSILTPNLLRGVLFNYGK